MIEKFKKKFNEKNIKYFQYEELYYNLSKNMQRLE